MDEDQLAKLYAYMTERFDSINEQLAQTSTKEEVNDLRNTVVDFAGHLQDNETEMASTLHQVDRMKVLHVQTVADKVGINLDTIHA